jgi:hypothetical protein
MFCNDALETIHILLSLPTSKDSALFRGTFCEKKSGKDQSHYTKYYKLQFSRVIPSLKMSINVTFFVKFNVCCAPQHLHVVKIDVNNIKLYQGIRLMPYKTKT